jgi:hypothetical protein
MKHPENPLFAFSVMEIQRVCGVDVTTARRWKKRSKRAICPPLWAIALLEGDLAFLDPAWRGWHLIRGDLVSPENWIIPMGQVLATQLLGAQLAAYQSENRGLKAQLADALVNRLEEQPLPDEWDVRIVNE